MDNTTNWKKVGRSRGACAERANLRRVGTTFEDVKRIKSGSSIH